MRGYGCWSGADALKSPAVPRLSSWRQREGDGENEYSSPRKNRISAEESSCERDQEVTRAAVILWNMVFSSKGSHGFDNAAKSSRFQPRTL